MKSISLLVATILGILLPLLSESQTTPPLKLEEAIRLGLENNKSLKISSARVETANAKYEEAYDATLPAVKLSAGYTRLSDIEEPKIQFPGTTEPVSLFPVYVNNYMARLSVSEPVFTGFRLAYAKKAQELLRDAARFDAGNDKEELSFTIASAYYNLYKLEASEKLVAQNLEAIHERIRETELWEQQGIATHNDVLRWQLQESNFQLTKIDLENNLKIAGFDFNLMIGLAENTIVQTDTLFLQQTPPTMLLAEQTSNALSKRYDLQASDNRAKVASNNLRIAQNSYWPWLSVGGNAYDDRPNPRVIPPVDEARFTWDLGVSLTWDLTNLYSNRHVIAEAKSKLTENESAHDYLSDQIRSEVNRTYTQYIQSQEKVTVMIKAQEQAQENFRLMDSRYQNSLVTLSDLLEANSTLLQAQINLALARADVQVALSRLKKSTGSL